MNFVDLQFDSEFFVIYTMDFVVENKKCRHGNGQLEGEGHCQEIVFS